MIEVKHLTKLYGEHTAVSDLSFTIEDGRIYGFLGPNGAGKSTTMNIMTGCLAATSGDVSIDGHDIFEDANEAKKLIGYLPEQPPLYIDSTPREYLQFVAEAKRVAKSDIKRQIAQVMEVTQITDVADRLIRNLSKGYRQRVGIAQALLGNPKVIILDEPTVGLDPNQIIEIRTLIKNLGKHHTVILSSHILPEIEAVGDRIVVINKGAIVADDTASDLSKKYSSDRRTLIRVAGPEEDVLGLLSRVPGVQNVTPLGEKESGVFEYALDPAEGQDFRRELFDRLSARKWPLMGMKSMEMTLEEIFIALTRETIPHGSTKSKKGGKKK